MASCSVRRALIEGVGLKWFRASRRGVVWDREISVGYLVFKYTEAKGLWGLVLWDEVETVLLLFHSPHRIR